jgi:hypothetical protein
MTRLEQLLDDLKFQLSTLDQDIATIHKVREITKEWRYRVEKLVREEQEEAKVVRHGVSGEGHAELGIEVQP